MGGRATTAADEIKAATDDGVDTMVMVLKPTDASWEITIWQWLSYLTMTVTFVMLFDSAGYSHAWHTIQPQLVLYAIVNATVTWLVTFQVQYLKRLQFIVYTNKQSWQTKPIKQAMRHISNQHGNWMWLMCSSVIVMYTRENQRPWRDTADWTNVVGLIGVITPTVLSLPTREMTMRHRFRGPDTSVPDA
jgi:hypothetical protein